MLGTFSLGLGSGVLSQQQQLYTFIAAAMGVFSHTLLHAHAVRLARQSHKERQASIQELQILCSLVHRNVLDFIEAWVESGCVVCLVVALCER
jgi:hypothetical protein